MAGWEALLSDLEAQAESLAELERDAEVADRTRREVAEVTLAGRVAAQHGHAVVVAVAGGMRLGGCVSASGPDWFLLDATAPVAGLEALVVLDAVRWIEGLSAEATVPSGRMFERMNLAWALRRIVRDRGVVRVLTVDAGELLGTLDRVAADHLDIAEHPPDIPRRRASVTRIRTVPLAEVAAIVRM